MRRFWAEDERDVKNPAEPASAEGRASGDGTRAAGRGWDALAMHGTGGGTRAEALAAAAGDAPPTALEAEATRVGNRLARAAPAPGPEEEARLPSSGGGRRSWIPPRFRAFLESSMGYDLSAVEIQTSGEQSRKVASLGARGGARDGSIAVNPGGVSLRTDDGRRLIAHEVAHLIQQGSVPRKPGVSATIPEVPMPRGAPPELQLDPGGGEDVPELPGYTQAGETCGATSLVSALMIWDRQRDDADVHHDTLVTACNLVLTYLAQHRDAAIAGWNDRGVDGEELHRRFRTALRAIRDHARIPGSTISEPEYRAIGMALYFLYVDGDAGLSAADISGLQARLGLETEDVTSGARSFDDIMSDSVLRSLGPGQIAQVGWYVRTGDREAEGRGSLGGHVFLIGRFGDGRWFLSDQGQSPPAELTAPTLGELWTDLEAEVRAGRSWIYLGRPSRISLGLWTGVRRLAGPEGVEAEAAGLVSPGRFLAEVDAGWTVTGDRLHAGDFVSRHYDLSEASSVYTAGHGGLIVEMPRGVFSHYRTERVRDANLSVSDIDRSDSSGGLLTHRTFYHAWLRLCSENACRAELLQVY